ncbi:unnamed protein product [Cylindrotheca closterium]|uniref:PS II complex 12 kDa extrinsic protein n=1 Tax=Cylindrotheca closterium TaxID=2856 RepID=A0AAD2CR15_9STRA|nr:unnamed protein product [Cylindrotheca closterium]
MKLSAVVTLCILAVSSAFAPAPSAQTSKVVMNAEQSRMEFLSAAGLAVFGAAIAPGVAGAMDQENVNDPTEVWETGKPSADAKSARAARYATARTQMTSNFPPIKRTTLERKSPVTRLDINAPDFTAYKKTYPGLFRE